MPEIDNHFRVCDNEDECLHLLASLLQDKGLGDIFDATTGQVLRGELVKAARVVEMNYFNDKHVWDKCPLSEALSRTGKKPISVRWVDVNKGDDDDEPNYSTEVGWWRGRFARKAIIQCSRQRRH